LPRYKLDMTKNASLKRLPGEDGVWGFVLGDMVMFTMFFATFLFYRQENGELFAQSQRLLNQNYGVINTLLLLTSSWFVALSVFLYRKGDTQRGARLLIPAFACGAGFVVIKFFEFGEKVSAGITLNSNEFFTLYFMFTGIHLLHVLVGLGVLFFLWSSARRATDGSALQTLENGGIFWHMVDLLWIVLFPLIYLV
jgi:nitric oxide reductase NorE protein